MRALQGPELVYGACGCSRLLRSNAPRGDLAVFFLARDAPGSGTIPPVPCVARIHPGQGAEFWGYRVMGVPLPLTLWFSHRCSQG